MNYAERTHAEHLRLSILKLLAGQAGYSANDSVLADGLAAVGFRLSRDQVRGALAWLDEQDLIRIETFEHLRIATATERGVEVAGGVVVHPGVKRPAPR